jgi:two-component system cell cycle sensor histidine kinase/response regulator CckA
VLVEVEDTGTGIPPEIIKNVFEPFFSTKEVGSGTGLGLATCYGIIKQTGGYIYVRSTVAVGTTFCLYFKSFQSEQPTAKIADGAADNSASDLTGKATIMLVEDETPVRIFAARALRNKGYEVLEADSGETALEVFSGHSGDIDMIISDVVMPGMNGPKMIVTLEEKFPERMKQIPVVFISGYAEDAFIDSFGAERSFNFLPKPFTLKQLAGKVKDVLDKATEAA